MRIIQKYLYSPKGYLWQYSLSYLEIHRLIPLKISTFSDDLIFYNTTKNVLLKIQEWNLKIFLLFQVIKV